MVMTARGFCVCHRTTDRPELLPAPGAAWHYLCDKPVLPCRTCGFYHPEKDCPRWPAREDGPPEYDPDDGEAQRIADVYADARAEQDRGL